MEYDFLWAVHSGSVLCDLPVLKSVDKCNDDTQSAGDVAREE